MHSHRATRNAFGWFLMSMYIADRLHSLRVRLAKYLYPTEISALADAERVLRDPEFCESCTLDRTCPAHTTSPTQETGTAPLAQQLRNAAAVSDLGKFLATHKVEGVVSGSELEESIRRARREIASWPDSVKRAMGVPLAPSQWSPDAESPTLNR
jgi:hypothetical protein